MLNCFKFYSGLKKLMTFIFNFIPIANFYKSANLRVTYSDLIMSLPVNIIT